MLSLLSDAKGLGTGPTHFNQQHNLWTPLRCLSGRGTLKTQLMFPITKSCSTSLTCELKLVKHQLLSPRKCHEMKSAPQRGSLQAPCLLHHLLLVQPILLQPPVSSTRMRSIRSICVLNLNPFLMIRKYLLLNFTTAMNCLRHEHFMSECKSLHKCRKCQMPDHATPHRIQYRLTELTFFRSSP